MNLDDRRQATDLDGDWDALALRGTLPEGSALDRETAALLTRMWAWSAPPNPATAREHVRQRLQQRRDEEGAMIAPALTPMHTLPKEVLFAPGERGSATPTTIGHPARWKAIPAFLATAAILALALAVTLLATGSLPRSWRAVEPTGLPAVLMAPATPSATAATATTLLDVTIPPALLPQGARISSIFEYATGPAGSTGHWLAANSAGQPGLRVHHLLEGSIDVRAEDASQIVRAGSATAENVAAGTQVTVGPGDTWIARNETAFEASNQADTPAHILIWILANVEDAGGVLNYPAPSTWVEETYTLDQPAPGEPGIEMPASPATLRIQRIELDAKASYPPAAHGLQYGVASPFKADGSTVVGPSVASQPSGKLVNLGRKPATAYVLNFSAAAEAATPAP